MLPNTGCVREGPDLVDDCQSLSTPTEGTAVLSVAKTLLSGIAAPGATLVYKISAANTGNDGAAGVTLTETVPANTTFSSTASDPGWTCSGGSPAHRERREPRGWRLDLPALRRRRRQLPARRGDRHRQRGLRRRHGRRDRLPRRDDADLGASHAQPHEDPRLGGGVAREHPRLRAGRPEHRRPGRRRRDARGGRPRPHDVRRRLELARAGPARPDPPPARAARSPWGPCRRARRRPPSSPSGSRAPSPPGRHS